DTSTMLTTRMNGVRFVDAFRGPNPKAQGPTVWQRIEAPQSTVSRRVDFILFLNGRKSTASVLSSRIVLDRPGQLPNGSTLWPSDHHGVLAELAILPVNRAQANKR